MRSVSVQGLFAILFLSSECINLCGFGNRSRHYYQRITGSKEIFLILVTQRDPIL